MYPFSFFFMLAYVSICTCACIACKHMPIFTHGHTNIFYMCMHAHVKLSIKEVIFSIGNKIAANSTTLKHTETELKLQF